MNFTKLGVILERGSGPTDWDRGDIANPCVYLDIDNGRWVMAYSGYNPTLTAASGFTQGSWSLGIAYADYDPDDDYGGLGGPWTKEAANPVLTPNYATEGYICCNGSLVARVESGTKYYYYFYMGTPSLQARTFVARSTDLVNWTRLNSGNPVISDVITPDLRCTESETEVFDLFFPGIVSDPGLRDCWKACSPDGLTWLRKRLWRRPPFADANLGAISPLRVGSDFRTLHDMSDGAPEDRVLALSYSNDEHMTISHTREVLSPTPAAFDSATVFDARVYKFGNKLLCIYSGGSNATIDQDLNADIGLAVSEYDPSVVTFIPSWASGSNVVLI